MDSIEFLHSVWGLQGEGYAFLSFRRDDQWRDLAYEFPEDEIELPDPRKGDIYFCPNLFSGLRRAREDALPSCWLYADLDRVVPRRVQVEMSPSVAWESSPGRYQAMWHLDRHLEIGEHGELNKKLTYALGADKSGWDTTQVLRVPGTLNHKYEGNPEVRLLWEDEEEHDEVLGEMRHHPDILVPRVREGSREAANISSQELLRVYKDVIPTWIRARLKAKSAPGDRSRVLWKIMCGLFECDMNEGEVFVLVNGSVWNKFDNEDDLWRDIYRASAAAEVNR